MSTAVTPFTTNDSIGLYWSPNNATSQYYFYMHFAEIENLQANQSREFNIFLNGDLWYKALSPRYLVATTIYSPTYRTKPDSETKFKIWINKTETSTLPPILNAIEIYTVNQLLQAQTDQKDGMFLSHESLSIFTQWSSFVKMFITPSFVFLTSFISFGTYDTVRLNLFNHLIGFIPCQICL